ncbi:MAG: hypothetical protein CM1200mP2_49010 [Planctomycetaceae bacterium]|nr:MAG: hypothetical protein CM1200mP2_49010 [Planctomycetaceae bacterium]
MRDHPHDIGVVSGNRFGDLTGPVGAGVVEDQHLEVVTALNQDIQAADKKGPSSVASSLKAAITSEMDGMAAATQTSERSPSTTSSTWPGNSSGNIGNERISEASFSATGNSPSLYPR